MPEIDLTQLRRALSGAPYPLSRTQLGVYARNRQLDAHTLELLSRIPDRDYVTANEVEQAIKRLDDQEGASDPVEEAGEESFPASDPPSWNP